MIKSLKISNFQSHEQTNLEFSPGVNINSIAPKCACGCGQPVKWAYWNNKWNKYLKNHRQIKGGWSHSEETKLKIKKTNQLIHNTEEVKEKKIKSWQDPKRRIQQSLKQKEIWGNPEFYLKMCVLRKENWNKLGYLERQKNKKHTPETKRIMSEHSRAMWTDEYKQQYSQAHQGEANNNWKGGLSFLPYSPKFTKVLKAEIKERDNYTCQNPNCPKTKHPLSVHHIDYDKQNCNKDNLITLCMPCNQRANGNRKYWTKLYQKIIHDKEYQDIEFSITSEK